MSKLWQNTIYLLYQNDSKKKQHLLSHSNVLLFYVKSPEIRLNIYKLFNCALCIFNINSVLRKKKILKKHSRILEVSRFNSNFSVVYYSWNYRFDHPKHFFSCFTFIINFLENSYLFHSKISHAHRTTEVLWTTYEDCLQSLSDIETNFVLEPFYCCVLYPFLE